jgi:hypothetical protein
VTRSYQWTCSVHFVLKKSSRYRYSTDAFNCNSASCDRSAGDQCPQLQKWNGRVVAHVPIFSPRLPTDFPSTSSYRYSIDAFNCNAASCDCSAGDHECYRSLDQCPQLPKWNGKLVAHLPKFPTDIPIDFLLPNISTDMLSNFPTYIPYRNSLLVFPLISFYPISLPIFPTEIPIDFLLPNNLTVMLSNFPTDIRILNFPTDLQKPNVSMFALLMQCWPAFIACWVFSSARPYQYSQQMDSFFFF